MFIIRLLYWRFFSRSCFSNTFCVFELHCDAEFVLVTRTSKNAFCPSLQTPLALISDLALSPPSTISPSTGCNGGSMETSEWTLDNRFASQFRILLCLIIMNPPFLQFSAWVTSYFWPHGHFVGNPFSYLPYLNCIESLNSPLFKQKPYSSRGRTPNHDEAPGNLASFRALEVSMGSSCLIRSTFSSSILLRSLTFSILISLVISLPGSWEPCIIIMEASGAEIAYDCS